MKLPRSTAALATFGALALWPLSPAQASDPAKATDLAAPVSVRGLTLTDLEGPEFADVDGDGAKDFLSGTYAGTLLFRKNSGSNSEPVFSEPVALQTGGKDIKLKHW